VRVSKVGDKVILEPIAKQPIDFDKFWAELDALGARRLFARRHSDDPPLEPDRASSLTNDLPRYQYRHSDLNGRDPSLRHRLEEQLRAGTKVGMPVVALFEMRFGISKSNRREHSERLLERFSRARHRCSPFDAEDAAHAGDIRGDLERRVRRSAL